MSVAVVGPGITPGQRLEILERTIVRYAVALATVEEFIDAGERGTTLLVDPSYVAMKILERAWDILGMLGIQLTLHEYQYLIGFRQNAKIAAEDVIRYALPVLKQVCGREKLIRIIKGFRLEDLTRDKESMNKFKECREALRKKLFN
ncbi:MAG: hypothetical protein GSR77_05330 [Desulfurococcales archaeon]|nr:hypothetical protein [Desulfurococcales archaeon]